MFELFETSDDTNNW